MSCVYPLEDRPRRDISLCSLEFFLFDSRGTGPCSLLWGLLGGLSSIEPVLWGRSFPCGLVGCRDPLLPSTSPLLPRGVEITPLTLSFVLLLNVLLDLWVLTF